jgi:hypothetical protein
MQYSDYSTYPAFDPKAPAAGIYTLAQAASLETCLSILQQSGCRVFRLEGAKVTTADRYFAALAALFQFPDYFGQNWDAVADCLTDLDWQSGDRIVVVHSDTQAISGIDGDVLTAVWRSTIEFWQQQGVMVAVVMS